jgi:putative signal transducing protein
MAAARMIRFYIARQRYDAWLVADRLKQVGIRAHVFNQHASSIVGDLPCDDVAQPQVWLEREADRERAEIVLREIEAAGSHVGNVKCPACGEDSPANFELCWNCGASL